jgi:AAA+ superfamily predicted ATPase
MEPEPTVLDSLRKAVEAMPDDVPLRLHLATMLLLAGQRDEAVRQLGAVLQRDPGNAQALGLLREPGPEGPVGPVGPVGSGAPGPAEAAAQPPAAPRIDSPERGGLPAPPPPPAPETGDRGQQYDWSQAEDELRDVLPAMFVGDGETADSASAGIDEADAYDAEHTGLSLADVAGMTEVKQRLEAAFLAPMRNPDLRRLYGKSLRGGLLLYGPPGCGKTFIARAVAGELGARFIAVSFADIIDMFVGQSERNIHELFEVARRNAPCVLFLDEVDAIGQKRSQLRNTPMRSAVNQLLLELDDISGNNEGVFLLAATNHPWDVDSALRRPGRFDRTLLVLPPDVGAREGVFRYHLKERPVAGIDLAKLAKQTDGYSGADIAHICETAAERALLDSVRRGEPRMIGTPDLEAAIGEVKPSLGAWFDTARNVALFANENGSYDDLAAYLRKRRLI